MSKREGGSAGGLFVLIIVAALGIGIATAMHNSNTPLAKQQRAVRDAEERAQASCRAAGCPAACFNAGMC